MKQFRSHIGAALSAGLIASSVFGALASSDDHAAKMERRPPPPLRNDFPVHRCINVSNALDAPNEGEWGYRIEERHFALISEAGFDTVRITIRWSGHLVSIDPVIIEPAFFDRVQEVVDQALGAELNVIIDVHHFIEVMEAPRENAPVLAGMWREIGQRFADYSNDRLFFELLNEPRDALDETVWREVMDPALAAIRELNPERPVIVGGPHWNSVYGLLRFEPPPDANLVGTFHFYEPHEFTHQGADFGDDAPPLGRNWGSLVDVARLRIAFAQAESWGARHGMPIFLGEFGVFRDADIDQRARYTRAARQEAENLGMGWCAFDFAASFITFDLENDVWIPELVNALGLAEPVEAPRPD